MRVSQSSLVWSQGASEGRGTCDWPPRIVLKGSAVGAAQVELRGLIIHDHSVNVNGGVITTNGDTRLMIINATFTRNKVVRVAPAEAAAPRAAGLGRRAALASRTHGCGAWRRVLGSGGAACARRAWLAWCAALWRGVHCAGAACRP